jgi:hypothetical protein
MKCIFTCHNTLFWWHQHFLQLKRKITELLLHTNIMLFYHAISFLKPQTTLHKNLLLPPMGLKQKDFPNSRIFLNHEMGYSYKQFSIHLHPNHWSVCGVCRGIKADVETKVNHITPVIFSATGIVQRYTEQIKVLGINNMGHVNQKTMFINTCLTVRTFLAQL